MSYYQLNPYQYSWAPLNNNPHTNAPQMAWSNTLPNIPLPGAPWKSPQGVGNEGPNARWDPARGQWVQPQSQVPTGGQVQGGGWPALPALPGAPNVATPRVAAPVQQAPAPKPRPISAMQGFSFQQPSGSLGSVRGGPNPRYGNMEGMLQSALSQRQQNTPVPASSVNWGNVSGVRGGPNPSLVNRGTGQPNSAGATDWVTGASLSPRAGQWPAPVVPQNRPIQQQMPSAPAMPALSSFGVGSLPSIPSGWSGWNPQPSATSGVPNTAGAPVDNRDMLWFGGNQPPGVNSQRFPNGYDPEKAKRLAAEGMFVRPPPGMAGMRATTGASASPVPSRPQPSVVGNSVGIPQQPRMDPSTLNMNWYQSLDDPNRLATYQAEKKAANPFNQVNRSWQGF